MTDNLTQLKAESVRKCLELGLELNGRKTPKYSNPRTTIKTLEDLEKFENEHPNAALRSYDINLNPNEKYPNGLVAIDTEDKKVWDIFVEMSKKGEFGDVIMNPTPRGGHVIFEATYSRKSAIKATLNAGMKADYLTSKVTVISVDKYISQMPAVGKALSKLPYELSLCKPVKKLPIIESDKITEGSRNNTLFVWGNNITGTYEERLKACYVIGRYFCNPPLPDDEILQVVKNTPEENKGKVHVDPNEKVAEKIRKDIIFIKDLLVNKFIYVLAQKLIYEFTGTHWEPISDLEYEARIEQIILDNAENISVKLKESNTLQIAKGHATRSKVYLQPPDSWFQCQPGKNFKNGYLTFTERKLHEHTHDRWVTDTSPIDYEKKEKISLENQGFLVDALGRSKHSVNLLRAAGYRALCPQPLQQTGFHWSGPPGCGKSTILSFFSYILGNLAKSCEVADLCNPFSRHEVVGCHLLIINELTYLLAKEERHIITFLGRDLIASEIKNRQGYMSQVFNGIIIITSNMGAEITLGKSLPLADRFFSLEFDARSGKPDPSLQSRLIANSSGLVNWFLSINEAMLRDLTRASLENKEASFENSLMAQFVCDEISYEKDVFIMIVDFKDSYNNFLTEKGLGNTKYPTDQVVEFLTVTMSLFNTRIVKRRVRVPGGSRKWALLGACLRVPGGSVPKFLNKSYEIPNDIWENYRDNSVDKFVEIPVQNDLLPQKGTQLQGILAKQAPLGPLENKELVSIVTRKNEINYSLAPVTTTARTPISPVRKAKSDVATKKEKSELVYSTPKDKYLYPLRQKLPKQKVNKKTITDDSESHKYVDLDLPEHNILYKKQIFKESHKLFCERIHVPLTELPLDGNFKYHPHTLFPNYNTVRRRAELLMELGGISSNLMSKLGGSETIWCQTLRSVRIENPPKPGQNKKRINLFQTKNNFTGKVLPEHYFWDDNGSPRYTSRPSHTIREVPRKWRRLMYKAISRHANVHLYDCDLSSCHARVIMLFLSKKEAPLLYKSFQEKDLYMDITKEILKNHKILRAIPIKVLRKIVKIKSLAMLNGGGTGKAEHITDLLSDLFPKESEMFKKLLPVLVNVLKELPIVKEFYNHGRFIYSKEYVYILTHSGQIRSSNSPHILNSPVLCSVETLIMTYLLEFLGGSEDMMVPLATQHDGAIMCCMDKLTDCGIESLNINFAKFLQERIGISLPIEFDDIGVDSLATE